MRLRIYSCCAAIFIIASFTTADVPRGEGLPRSDDQARQPPAIIRNPGAEYSPEFAKFIFVPCIDIAPKGRLWAAWTAGGEEESRYNYFAINTSDDDGITWSDMKLIVDPGAAGAVEGFSEQLWRTSMIGEESRKTTDRYIAAKPVTWIDPQGRIWLFWSQRASGTTATWAMISDNPDSANPVWSKPRHIADGLITNKPTVLTTGEWLIPLQSVVRFVSVPLFSEKGPEHDQQYFDYSAGVIISKDAGKSFEYLGAANIAEESWRAFDEHMIVELKDGRLWMLMRLHESAGGYLGESISDDRGKTWSQVQLSNIRHTSSLFHIRRLKSGKLLLIKHGPISGFGTDLIKSATTADDSEWQALASESYLSRPFGYERHSLMAFLSDNDGKSWYGGLIIDERHRTYPDVAEGENGDIYLIYDSRYSADGVRGIYVARFNEADIKQGVSMRLDNVGSQYEIVSAGGLNLRRPDMEISDNKDGADFISPDGAVIEPVYGMVSKLVKDAELFVDRPFRVLQVPQGLYGRNFVRASFDGAQAVVKRSGGVYVLTPSPKRDEDKSQHKLLLEQGFHKVALREAAIYLPHGRVQRYEPNNDKTIVTVYQKQVEPDEIIKIDSWGIIVF